MSARYSTVFFESIDPSNFNALVWNLAGRDGPDPDLPREPVRGGQQLPLKLLCPWSRSVLCKMNSFFFLNSVHSLTRFGLALFHPSQRYKCHICSVSTLYLSPKDRRKREEVGYTDAPHLSKTVRRKAFLQFNLINGRPMWYVICYSSLVLYASLDLSYQSLSMGIFCLQFVLWSW